MKLLSVNVSLAKQVQFNQKTISTGIFKQPVSGAVEVSPFKLAGDQQVDLKNHGGEHKAVYGFSANHYPFWQQKLGLDDLEFGRFGENLTITDLDESRLCIGDQLMIGDCVLEITQPRVPCFKLGIAFELEDMPRMFVEHAATGIYFRVMEPGFIQAGNLVTQVKLHPARLTVQRLFHAYFDKQMAKQESDAILQQALEIEPLSKEWRDKITARLYP